MFFFSLQLSPLLTWNKELWLNVLTLLLWIFCGHKCNIFIIGNIHNSKCDEVTSHEVMYMKYIHYIKLHKREKDPPEN